MTLWLVRAGKLGERESLALRENLAIIGWDELPDMGPCTSRAGLDALLRHTYPDQKAKTLASWHGQLWSIRDTMKGGDLVVLPLKSRASVAIGTVSGDYAHRGDLPDGLYHTRPVQWHAEVPRRAFDMDILLSFGAFMTVCRIERNDAEQRVRALMAAESLCSPPASRALAVRPEGAGLALVEPPAPAPLDLEQRCTDLIRDRIARTFKGHALAELVAAILEAQGFRTRLSPPGPDGGVDILAGGGPFGFDGPRLVVQVKSSDARLDVRPFRELAGVMTRFGAEHGLLVGWGGFNGPVRAEAAADYFRIRLWDAADLVAAVAEHYAALSPAIRARLPLKQVWTLADPAAEAA